MSSRITYISVLCSIIFMATLSLVAAAPANPAPDPYPGDNDPYPPTDATLYYEYPGGLVTSPEFIIPVAGGTVKLKLVPKNLEEYAVGYFSEFSKGTTPTPAQVTAMDQTNGAGAYIWPCWEGDSTNNYVTGEESTYWNGRRYYYEDLPWEGGDKDLDDLWVDIAWRHIGGNAIEIKAVVKCNRAGYANPFQLTFEKEEGTSTVYFTYQIHEPSAGSDETGGFMLTGSPVTISLFETGDEGDWGRFYGSVPVLPFFAIPAGLLASALIVRKRR